MSWYDPTSWALFSDWGAASWSEELEAAVEQAEDWTGTVADAKGWSGEDLGRASDLIVSSAEAAEDVAAFWSLLASSWGAEGGPEGWAELGDTFAAAATAAASTAEGRESGTVGEVVAGAAAGSAEDLADGADWLRTWGPWVALVLLVLGTVVLAWRVGR